MIERRTYQLWKNGLDILSSTCHPWNVSKLWRNVFQPQNLQMIQNQRKSSIYVITNTQIFHSRLFKPFSNSLSINFTTMIFSILWGWKVIDLQFYGWKLKFSDALILPAACMYVSYNFVFSFIQVGKVGSNKMYIWDVLWLSRHAEGHLPDH